MWRTQGKGHGDTQPAWPSGTQRIMQWFGMERTFKDYLLSNMLPWTGTPSLATRLLKASSSVALNTSMDGTATASEGDLFHCVTTPIITNFLLMFNMNLPSFNLKLLLFVLLLKAHVKLFYHLFFFFPNLSNTLKACNEVSLATNS